MNKESNNLWQESRTGRRGIQQWWLIVVMAAFLLAAITTTVVFFGARWELYEWGSYFPYSIQRRLSLSAVLVGLEVMAAYVWAIALAFVLYRGGRRIFARPITSTPAATRDLIDNGREQADPAVRPVKPAGPAGHIAPEPVFTDLPASTDILMPEARPEGFSPSSPELAVSTVSGIGASDAKISR